VGITITAAITFGAVTIIGSLGGSGGADRLSVQVKADLNHAVAVLAALGFRSTRSTSPSTPSPRNGTDCAASATGAVRQFLARHPCKEWASATLTARKQGAAAPVAITWVVMPTVALAGQYKARVDTFGQGNPPGESLFDGLCYASGQDGATVWTEQVQPGHLSVNADREILQAAAPRELPRGYLQQHCRP